MSYNSLENNHNSHQNKAIQKYPFRINDKTYFNSECYSQKQIINGVSLNLKQARGIPNNLKLISYLQYSQRLIFYIGTNIMAYNSYKKIYQEITHAQNLVHLKALSLKNIQTQYILWVQKCKRQRKQQEIQIYDIESNTINQIQFIQPKSNQEIYYYKVCLYDLRKEEIIMKQNFLIPLQYQDIFVFIHPIKVIGFVFNTNQQIIFNYKKNQNKKNHELCLKKLHKNLIPSVSIKLIYNIQNNQYLFLSQNKIYSLNINKLNEYLQENTSDMKLFASKIIDISQTQGYILDFSINPSLILLLIKQQQSQDVQKNYNNKEGKIEEAIQIQINHQIKFYSLFSHDQILNKKLNTFINYSPSPMTLPTKFQVTTNTIILYNQGSPIISIWSIYELNLKFIKEVHLNSQNFYRLQNFYINPYSSQAIILTSHYEIQNNMSCIGFSNVSKSNRALSLGLKDSYVQISLFHFAADILFYPMKKMNLRKKKYLNILCCPWMSQYIFQTENSIISLNWQQKLQYTIKCSSIHPTGQYLILGSNDFFKIYSITFDGIQNTYIGQVVKDCVSVDYHPSGRQFSVASSTLITIYHTYKFIKLYHINLTLSHRVKDIFYESDGQYLTLLTQNKRIHSYRIKQIYQEQFTFNPRVHLVPQKNSTLGNIIGCPKQINNQPQIQYVSAILYDQQVGVVIYSLNNYIYFLSSLTYQSLGCFEFQSISCFYLYKPLGTLFIGTSKGDIVCFPWPNKPINIKSQLPRYHCHSIPINKIRVTSDRLQLISLTDESYFRHQLSFIVNMRKIEKFELQKQYHKKQVMILDFFVRKGFSFYTTDFWNSKLQKLKQFEDQIVNVNFFLPEQRQRQKNMMLKDYRNGQGNIENENLKILLPLKKQTVEFKKKLQIIKGQFIILSQEQKKKIEEETCKYEEKFKKINIEKDQLIKKRNQLILKLNQDLKIQKDKLKKKKIKVQNILNMKENDLKNKRQIAKKKAQQKHMDFLQIDQIQLQKQAYKKDIFRRMNQQIVLLKQRNAYLTSRNNNLSKQIMIEKRKIQDLKDLIQNIQRGMIKLMVKRKYKQIQNQQTNKKFFQTEKRYLGETKNLIQKGKATNVSIQVYQKQKNLLLALQIQLDKTQKSIDCVINYLSLEKKQKKQNSYRCNQFRKKTQLLIESQKKIKNLKVMKSNIQKDFKHKVALFIDNVLTVQQLRKLSKTSTKLCQFQHSSNLIQANMSKQNKQLKIIKSLANQQKFLTNIKQGQKVFLQEKKKINQHNQDLIDNVNTLSHQNRYLQNLIKTQQQRKKKQFKNYMLTKRKKKQTIFCTPTIFQNYITNKKVKSTRKVKTNPCAEYQL